MNASHTLVMGDGVKDRQLLRNVFTALGHMVSEAARAIGVIL